MKPLLALVSLLCVSQARADEADKAAKAPRIVTFDWPSVVECANRDVPEPPAELPQAGQPTDVFLRNYGASQTWGMQVEQIRLCQTALAAWQAGWEAGHVGKPKDPAAP